MNAATQASIRPRAVGVRIGKALALLSLLNASVGLFLYCTLERLDAPLLAWSGLKLADVWMLERASAAGECERAPALRAREEE